MLRLDIPTEPTWLTLRCGLRLRCLPLDTALLSSARSRAARRMYELTQERQDIEAAGGRVEGLPDFSDPDRFSGQLKFLMALALAEFGVVDWDTSACAVVGPDGEQLAFAPAHIPKLMRHGTVAEDFVERYTAPYERLEQEKNGSTTAPGGTSGAVASTAPAAATPTPPAAAASGAPTDTSAPTSSTSL